MFYNQMLIHNKINKVITLYVNLNKRNIEVNTQRSSLYNLHEIYFETYTRHFNVYGENQKRSLVCLLMVLLELKVHRIFFVSLMYTYFR